MLAVIVDEPVATPVTVPSLETVAFPCALDDHVIVALAGRTSSITSFTVEPTGTETVLCMMLTCGAARLGSGIALIFVFCGSVMQTHLQS